MTTEQRSERWAFRVTGKHDAIVSEAATLAGVSKTQFVVESALERAQEMIAERQRITLSPDEFSRFSDSLDKAPIVLPKLVALFDRSSQIPD